MRSRTWPHFEMGGLGVLKTTDCDHALCAGLRPLTFTVRAKARMVPFMTTSHAHIPIDKASLFRLAHAIARGLGLGAYRERFALGLRQAWESAKRETQDGKEGNVACCDTLARACAPLSTCCAAPYGHGEFENGHLGATRYGVACQMGEGSTGRGTLMLFLLPLVAAFALPFLWLGVCFVGCLREDLRRDAALRAARRAKAQEWVRSRRT